MKYLEKIARLLIFVFVAEMFAPIIPQIQIGVTQAFADQWVCGQDLQNDGYFGDSGDTALCNATPQGEACPISNTTCAGAQTCPIANTPCSGGSCTETGTCSSTQVPITEYQCPATGQIYSDSTTCSNNCLQTASCTPSCPPGGSYNASTGTCNTNLTSYSYWATCTAGWNDDCADGSPIIDSTSPDSCAIDTADGETCFDNNCNITYWATTCVYHGGTAGCPISPGEIYSLRHAATSIGNYSTPSTGYSCPSGYTSNGSYCVASPTYSCPLTGGSSCSGNPPTCQAGSACVTQNNTTTEYQCSLTGTDYTTQNGCTSSCSKTASCGTSYTCPLGSQYTCMDNNGTMECSPNQCVDLTSTPATVTNTDSNMLQNDGSKDSSGNCLGQVYIFTGRGEACQRAGAKDGFHDCCVSSSGSTMQDSMGALTSIGTAYHTVETIYHLAQVAYYTNVLITQGTLEANLSPAVSDAVMTGAADGSVSAGMSTYLATLINPTTIALTVAIYLVQNFLLKGCSQQDMEVAMENASGYCHYVGDYCSDSWPLIGCVQKSSAYCCFNSKLGRIIQEQGRPQLKDFQPYPQSWGIGEKPNCRGFTPEEFQMLDFSKIDLSSYYGDLEKSLNVPSNIQGTEQQNIQQFYQNTQK